MLFLNWINSMYSSPLVSIMNLHFGKNFMCSSIGLSSLTQFSRMSPQWKHLVRELLPVKKKPASTKEFWSISSFHSGEENDFRRQSLSWNIGNIGVELELYFSLSMDKFSSHFERDSFKVLFSDWLTSGSISMVILPQDMPLTNGHCGNNRRCSSMATSPAEWTVSQSSCDVKLNKPWCQFFNRPLQNAHCTSSSRK